MEYLYEYEDWGGRGITVCDEWLHDFMAFYDWTMNNGYKDSLTIDRIDNNGNYEPNNRRWVTNKEQQRNTRKNVFLTYNKNSNDVRMGKRVKYTNQYNLL